MRRNLRNWSKRSDQRALIKSTETYSSSFESNLMSVSVLANVQFTFVSISRELNFENILLNLLMLQY